MVTPRLPTTQAAASLPATAGVASARGPAAALSPSALPARGPTAAVAPAAVVSTAGVATRVTPSRPAYLGNPGGVGGVAIGDGAFPAAASVNIPTVPVTSARPYASAGGLPGAAGGVPATVATPAAPVGTSAISAGLFTTTPAYAGGLLPATVAWGPASLAPGGAVPEDDGLVSYGKAAEQPVYHPPPPPRLSFGADSSRITGAATDDPATAAGNDNPFAIDRSQMAATGGAMLFVHQCFLVAVACLAPPQLPHPLKCDYTGHS